MTGFREVVDEREQPGVICDRAFHAETGALAVLAAALLTVAACSHGDPVQTDTAATAPPIVSICSISATAAASTSSVSDSTTYDPANGSTVAVTSVS